MKQLTIRGFDKALQRELEDLAREQNLSLNKAALELMRRGAGLAAESNPPRVVGDSLDHLIGTWSRAQEEEFLESLAPFETIDDSFWT